MWETLWNLLLDKIPPGLQDADSGYHTVVLYFLKRKKSLCGEIHLNPTGSMHPVFSS